jgi:FAD/FMN-containing dehydrogenase
MSQTIARLADLLEPGVVVTPTSDNVVRHSRDFLVTKAEDVEIVALTYPRNTEQVSTILSFCNQQRIGVVPQGGMTGMAGGGVPASRCVVLSLERMRQVLEIDQAAGTMTVEAGAPLEAVQNAADAADLLFPLDLGARGSCQVGGNASTNAGGNRVLRYGMMRELVVGVEAVLADGTIIDSLRKMLKNNTGYDLRQLFIGSEGTLGVITRLVLRLHSKPRSLTTGLCALASYDDLVALLGQARSGFGSTLTAFETMWPDFYALGTVALGRNPPLALGHDIYVLIETAGTDPEVDQARFETVIGEALESGLVKDAVVAKSKRESQEIWAIRDCPGEFPRVFWPQTSFDISVPTGEIGQLFEELNASLHRRWPQIRTVFFGHVADGNLHLSTKLPEVPEHEVEELVYRIVGARHGSISAEHGIGLHKREYLHHSRTPAELSVMRTLKTALDPNGILNPGKIF